MAFKHIKKAVLEYFLIIIIILLIIFLMSEF